MGAFSSPRPSTNYGAGTAAAGSRRVVSDSPCRFSGDAGGGNGKTLPAADISSYPLTPLNAPFHGLSVPAILFGGAADRSEAAVASSTRSSARRAERGTVALIRARVWFREAAGSPPGARTGGSPLTTDRQRLKLRISAPQLRRERSVQVCSAACRYPRPLPPPTLMAPCSRALFRQRRHHHQHQRNQFSHLARITLSSGAGSSASSSSRWSK